jgi:hypothetical protein
VNDPSGSPTQILGKIDAPGQVYVINQNGIIFGGSSQINVHNLTASSLPINDALISRGLLNQEAGKVRFLFSGMTADPAFTLGVDNTYTLRNATAASTQPALSYADGAATVALNAGTDYTLGKNAAGKVVVTFTPDGVAKIGANPVTATR